MSIFSTIFGKIFPSAQAATGTANAPAAAPVAPADVDALLTSLAAKHSEKLNWKSSIVDLLKLLNMDSGLDARKKLAQELKYSGDMNDSAAMNLWLSAQVIKQIRESGGKIPTKIG